MYLNHVEISRECLDATFRQYNNSPHPQNKKSTFITFILTWFPVLYMALYQELAQQKRKLPLTLCWFVRQISPIVFFFVVFMNEMINTVTNFLDMIYLKFLKFPGLLLLIFLKVNSLLFFIFIKYIRQLYISVKISKKLMLGVKFTLSSQIWSNKYGLYADNTNLFLSQCVWSVLSRLRVMRPLLFQIRQL